MILPSKILQRWFLPWIVQILWRKNNEETIDSIINEDSKQKIAIGDSYETYMFLPYLKIANQERFLKSEIDKWLNYQKDNPLNK